MEPKAAQMNAPWRGKGAGGALGTTVVSPQVSQAQQKGLRLSLPQPNHQLQ